MDINNIDEIKKHLKYGACIEELKKNLKYPVVLCGYGAVGKLFIGMLYECNANLMLVCDKNNVGKEYEYITKGKIVSYEEIGKIKNKVHIIIASKDYYNDIKNEVIKYVSEDFILDVREIYKMIPQCYELKEPFIYQRYINNNIDRINDLIDKLQDEKSIETLKAVIKMRLSWNEEYVNDVVDKDMYFIKELKLTDNEVFVDGGAYDGDTLDDFLMRVVGNFDSVYCFEPGKNQYETLQNRVEKYKYKKNIHLYNEGLYSKSEQIGFTGNGTEFHVNNNEQGNKCKVIAIDGIKIKPTLIKLDVQGFELEALKGSINTIKKYKPSMAICVYHKMEDILDVVDWINSLKLNYKLYLRHHSKTINDTVLYAIK